MKTRSSINLYASGQSSHRATSATGPHSCIESTGIVLVAALIEKGQGIWPMAGTFLGVGKLWNFP